MSWGEVLKGPDSESNDRLQLVFGHVKNLPKTLDNILLEHSWWSKVLLRAFRVYKKMRCRLPSVEAQMSAKSFVHKIAALTPVPPHPEQRIVLYSQGSTLQTVFLPKPDSRDGRPKSPIMCYAFAYAGVTNVMTSDLLVGALIATWSPESTEQSLGASILGILCCFC